MTTGMGWWIGFNLFVLALLALDLGVLHRKVHEVRTREAVITSSVWILLALLFDLGLYLGWWGGYAPGEPRSKAALDFLTAYVIEKSLSVDNVFVFALLFRYFRVSHTYQHRVLFWGVLGALVMRAILILAGVALLETFHWLTYLLGAVLIFSGIKMWRTHGEEIEPDKNPVLKLIRRIFPVTPEEHGQKLILRIDGRLMVTPLFVVLVFVEWSDLVFAIDSIPAVLAVTTDSFVVYTSNVFAILGLRALYFALAGVLDKFRYLHQGLSAILIYVGAKMALAHFYKVPTSISLGIVAIILTVAVLCSIWRKDPSARQESEAPREPVARR